MLRDWTKRVENFYLVDGRIVGTLTELVRLLDEISEETFRYHVNDWKNDFYNWIYNCINPQIALAVKDKKTKEEMKNALVMELIVEVERSCE
ncbi:MAG: hypothetical protein QXD62_03380 [Candidatus Woesearchaeota archaeon]